MSNSVLQLLFFVLMIVNIVSSGCINRMSLERTIKSIAPCAQAAP